MNTTFQNFLLFLLLPVLPSSSPVPTTTIAVPMLCSRKDVLLPLTCRLQQWDAHSVPCQSLHETISTTCQTSNNQQQQPFNYFFTVESKYIRSFLQQTTTIPTHLHQTWKTRDVHPIFERYHSSWLKHHPLWLHQIWSDADNRQLVQTEYPELLEFYDNLSHTILRVDVVRFLILHRHGGVYADMDVESLKPMDELLNDPATSVLLGFELYEPTFIIEISIMGSVAGHPLWLKMVRDAVIADANPNITEVYDITGNRVFTKLVQSELQGSTNNSTTSQGIKVLPREYLYPPYPLRYDSRSETRCRCGPVAPVIGYPCHACKKMYPDSYTIHHGKHFEFICTQRKKAT